MNANLFRASGIVLLAIIAIGIVTVVVLLARQTSSTQPSSFGGVAVAAGSSDHRTLTVVGQGTFRAVPDQARLSLGVAPTRTSVQDANNVAADEQGRLIAALHAQGVEDKDIQTDSVNIMQNTYCCPSQVTGYSASVSVSVIIHHLLNVGPVMVAVVDAVGNDVRLNGTGLSVSDPSVALKAARVAALADAGARAGEWAANSKHHLGRIVTVSEGTDPSSS
ncbi:MAG: hypothetical protein NVS9B1_19850 [Candidatus Dormibacteraceae bacterium]